MKHGCRLARTTLKRGGLLAAFCGAICLALYPDLATGGRGYLTGWGRYVANGGAAGPFVAVVAGGGNVVGLRSDGVVLAWGDNSWGQCEVPEPNSDFVAIASGDRHTLALKADGSVVACGQNGAGQCNVPEPNTGFTRIAAGSNHSLGLKQNGSVVGWGSNGYGELNVPAPNAGFRDIEAAALFSIGLKADSTLVAWGYSSDGLLQIPQPNAGFVRVSAASRHCLALRADGSIVAWGYNNYGQCEVPYPNSDFIGVAAGDNMFSAGLKADGSIVIWGYNQGGGLVPPNPNTGFVAIDARSTFLVGLRSDGLVIAAPPDNWTSNAPIGADALASVAVSVFGNVRPFGVGLAYSGPLLVWGSNDWNQLVLPSPNDAFLVASAGRSHALALRPNGSIAAWGENNSNQCNVSEPNAGYAGIAAGNLHSLGVKSDGTVLAWGGNASGQCNVPSPNASFIAVAGGASFSLGLKRDGSIVGWGSNTYGQCSVPAPNTDFVAVAARQNHSLGLKADGRIVTWGNNADGQGNVPSPNAGFVGIAAGYAHNMGLRANGSVAAWGSNTYGQTEVPLPNADFVGIAAGQDLCLALRQVSVPEPPDHIVLTEIVAETAFDGIRQRGSDSFELHNPTAAAVDLSRVYVTDAGDRTAGLHYYDIVRRGAAGGGGTNGDFHARFPDGAVLAPGDTIVVSVAGSSQYVAAYGRLPDYELYEDFTAPDLVPELVEVFPGSVGRGLGSTGTNVPDLGADGETLVVYRWDGVSDLVEDLDYVTWGPDEGSRQDKTGVSVDGPDADDTESAYLPDVSVTDQQPVWLTTHAQGGAFQRRAGDEDGEVLLGGNGATGHAETAEPLAYTWSAQQPPTVAAAPVSWLRTAPIVTGLVLTPAAPVEGQAVTVDATVVSQAPLIIVRLHWSADGGAFTPVTCTSVGSIWRGQIPAQAAGTAIAWYFEAVAMTGARTTRPVEAPVYLNGYTVAEPPPEPPSVAGVAFTPAAPYGGAATGVAVSFGAPGGAPTAVSLFYRITGVTTELTASLAGETWTATLPAQPAGAEVDWWLRAANAGGVTWYPEGAPGVVNHFRVRDVNPPTGNLLAASGTAGATLTISAVLTDELGIANAWLFYRPGGVAAFDSVAMTYSAPFHTGAVPAAAVGARGIQYCVRAEDLDGNRAWFPAGAPQTLVGAAIVVPGHPVFTLDAQQYRLAGIPLIAGGGSPDSVFAALGPYDPAQWRYLTTPYEAETGYTEHPAALPARAGQGFWLIAREATDVQVGGWATRLDREFEIALAEGWNLVASPYAFPVDTAGVVYPAGTARDFIGHSATGYAHEVGTLEPGRGYFLWHGGVAGAVLRLPRPGSAAAKAGPVATKDAAGWSVQVSALCDGLADVGNRFGQRTGLANLREAPPAPGEQISLCFVAAEGTQFYTDYRSLDTAGEAWTLRLAGTATDRPVVLRFTPDGSLPADWRLVAVDLNDLRETVLWPSMSDGPVDLRVGTLAGGAARTWRLIAGPEGYVADERAATREAVNAAVTAYALGPLWPNPVRSGEGLVLGLAVPHGGPVTVRVYDLRGRLVRTLQDGTLERGVHRLVWDGADAGGRRVAAGVYFARLQAAGVSLVEKVTVVR